MLMFGLQILGALLLVLVASMVLTGGICKALDLAVSSAGSLNDNRS